MIAASRIDLNIRDRAGAPASAGAPAR